MTVASNTAKWIAILCSPLFLTVHAIACSRVFPTYQVESDFVVLIADRGKPLSGIEVRVAREVKKPEFHFETVFWNTTDEKGEIAVHGLSPGRYFITATHADVESEQAAELEVSTKSPASRSKLTLDWPAHVIFGLQSIEGILSCR